MNRELLKNRPYLFLISAQTVSNLGDWLTLLALSALLGLKWQASPLAISIAFLCLTVPSIACGPFSGVIADRMDRKTLMILTDLFRAAVVIGVIFSSQLWEVYVLLCIKSIFSSLFEPAKEGKLREIVPNEWMQSAVATSELVNNGAKIAGPVLSGVFVATLGIKGSFYLDSASFLLSAILIIGVPITKGASQEAAEKTAFFKQFSEGFAFLREKRTLYVGLAVFALVILFLQIPDTQFIVLLREVPGHAIHLLGYIMAASGAGMIIASIILNKKEIRSYLLALSLSTIGMGIPFAFYGLLIHLPIFWVTVLFILFSLIVGFSFGMALIPFNVMVQKQTPERITGRVFGTINSVATLATVIGMSAGGIISEFAGVTHNFIFAGSVLVIIGVIVFLSRKGLEKEKKVSGQSAMQA
ncbi:MAG TPA: MFS transporter [Bacillales bacterium]|nr:MFS transporter [Bacillales bacterium]